MKVTTQDIANAVCGLDILLEYGYITSARDSVDSIFDSYLAKTLSLESVEGYLKDLLLNIKQLLDEGLEIYNPKTQEYSYSCIYAVELELVLDEKLWDMASGGIAPQEGWKKELYEVIEKYFYKQQKLNSQAAEKYPDFSRFWFKMTD